MIILASVWLGLSLLLSLYAWFAARRLPALLLPLSATIAAAALWVPTGSPRLTHVPAGKYTVVGAKIEVDVAIYALLDDGKSEPRFYRLPYSAAQANALQQAMDAAQNGQGVKATIDGQGGAQFDGPPPVTGEPPKQVEQPAVSIP
jgi:hypothetical protein